MHVKQSFNLRRTYSYYISEVWIVLLAKAHLNTIWMMIDSSIFMIIFVPVTLLCHLAKWNLDIVWVFELEYWCIKYISLQPTEHKNIIYKMFYLWKWMTLMKLLTYLIKLWCLQCIKYFLHISFNLSFMSWNRRNKEKKQRE